MNNYQLENILQGYPMTVCAADQIRKQRGKFVISTTDTSNGPGKHWVSFFFPKYGLEDILTRSVIGRKATALNLKRYLTRNIS
jgi:hypothetical protein